MIAARQRFKRAIGLGEPTINTSLRLHRDAKTSWKFRSFFLLTISAVVIFCLRLAYRPEADQSRENAVIVILARNEEVDALTVQPS